MARTDTLIPRDRGIIAQRVRQLGGVEAAARSWGTTKQALYQVIRDLGGRPVRNVDVIWDEPETEETPCAA